MFKPIIKNVNTGQELLYRSIKLRKSLDDICHILELDLAISEFSKVRKHHRLEVRCRNNLDTGYGGERCHSTVLVDEITASVSPEEKRILVIGRSPARDIIDSTWSDNDYEESTLRELVRHIAKKFDIFCDTFPENQPDPTVVIHNFSFENESPWVKLIDEADKQGYILTSNEIGNLYLWKVPPEGAIREPFHINEGKNIKNIKWTENGSEQFRKYVVKGGGKQVQTIDNSCLGKRILSIDITDPYVEETKLERRVDTEIRRKSEIKTIVTVSG